MHYNYLGQAGTIVEDPPYVFRVTVPDADGPDAYGSLDRPTAEMAQYAVYRTTGDRNATARVEVVATATGETVTLDFAGGQYAIVEV